MRPLRGDRAGDFDLVSRMLTPLQTYLLWRAPFTHLERSRRRLGERFVIRSTAYPPLHIYADRPGVRAVLTARGEDLHAGEGAAKLAPIVGPRSFMLADGPSHLASRRAVLSAFSAQTVERRANLVAEVASSRIATWPRDSPFHVDEELRKLVLEATLRRLFTRCETGRVRQLTAALLQMLSINETSALVEPHVRYTARAPTWLRFLRRQEKAEELLYALIDEQLDTRPPPDCPILALREAVRHTGVPDQRCHLHDDVMSVIVAGHETTAGQLAWAFELLLRHPSVLDRLTAEVRSGHSQDYLNATIREVLRHRPVFPLAIPRVTTKSVEIGGSRQVQDSWQVASIYLLHHDSALYPEPHQFKPERFLGAPIPAGAWAPWGGGLRRCPGLHHANLEMTVVLSTVLSQAELVPSSKRTERPKWRGMIVVPAGGPQVILRDRQPAHTPRDASKRNWTPIGPQRRSSSSADQLKNL